MAEAKSDKGAKASKGDKTPAKTPKAEKPVEAKVAKDRKSVV